MNLNLDYLPFIFHWIFNKYYNCIQLFCVILDCQPSMYYILLEEKMDSRSRHPPFLQGERQTCLYGPKSRPDTHPAVYACLMAQDLKSVGLPPQEVNLPPKTVFSSALTYRFCKFFEIAVILQSILLSKFSPWTICFHKVYLKISS